MYELRFYNSFSLCSSQTAMDARGALQHAYAWLLQSGSDLYAVHINKAGKHGMYVARLADLETNTFTQCLELLRKKFP